MRINKISKASQSPIITLSSPSLTGNCTFMIDSGSDINLIKKNCICSDIRTNQYNIVTLQGISPEPVSTAGSIVIPLLGRETEFHLVPDDIAFPQQGILGIRFLREHNAIIDFKNKCLHYDNSLIPFTETEYINIKPRSVTPFHVTITNPELTTGYLPFTKSIEGIYLGNAIVTNVNGRAYLPIFNTTDEEHNMEIPAVALQEYDIADNTVPRSPAADVSNNFNSDSITESYDDCNYFNFLTEVTSFDTRGSYRGFGIPRGAVNSRENQTATGHSSNFSTTSDPIDDRVNLTLQLLRTDHLNSEEKDHLTNLITTHSYRFQLPFDRLEHTSAAQHTIPTLNEMPIHTKQYRFPPVHKEEINRQVNTLLDDDIIEYSSSPYSSPVWIVPKKPDSAGNKRWRMVIDYRNLNEKTIGDAYPLPNITDILDQLGNAKYFSVLDLASGFHQIPMDPKDAPKTAFSTPYGHYQFKRMPFGLKNAPATFQRLMDNVLSGLQGNELFVYMDDIVVYAKSLQEHANKFERLMKRLKAANLKLQPDKCEFLRKEVAYLGHTISADGVRPDPNKIKAITEFPVPRSPTNIKQFLGLVGYYRRFIPQFSKIAKPLTDLLKKDRRFYWETTHTLAFNQLRKSLCSEPILQYPDFTRPFILTTDASGYAIGGVLSQGNIGKDLPIAYVSRVLNKAEQNYSVIEKECLAIVYCTNHFRPYLYGRKFTIVTDHKPLIWLHSIKDPSSRLWKWRTKLAEYDYEIQYKKGRLNNNADALSRNPPLATTLPLVVRSPKNGDQDDYSDDSLFSFPSRPPPAYVDTGEQQEERSLAEYTPPSINEFEPQKASVEELAESDDENYFSSESEDEDDDNDLFLSESVPVNADQNSNIRMNIIYSRENLLSQKDNLVIFIRSDGTPFDNGARELQAAQLLPQYKDIMFGRAKVSDFKGKILIALPLKLNDRTLVETDNIKNCMQSLVDAVTELEIDSFSMRKTALYDDIPWIYVHNQIIKYLRHIPINVTVCKDLIRIPDESERTPLIQESHASAVGGHKGVTKTYNRLRPHFHWSNMKKDIQKFIQQCRQCQLRKLTRVKTKQPMVITDTPGSAFDKVSLDIMGPLPITRNNNIYILTIQDLLTKYSIAVPLKEATSLTIADAFTKHFICLYGAPKIILTDQGTNFLSSLIRNLTKRFNIKHLKTTAYHPQSNGSLERSHHVLTEYLKLQIEKDNEWDEHIAMAMFSYNTSIHESTHYSPFELVFGRIPRTLSSYPPIEEETEETYHEYLTKLFNKIQDTQEDARKHLIKSKERSKFYYDRKINVCKFKPGDYVFLLKEPQKGKFSDQYTGPYKVIEILPLNNVKILFQNRPRIVHMDKLKLSHIDPG